MRRVLERLRQAEAEIETTSRTRADDIRRSVDRHLAALEEELQRARQTVEAAGEAADQRLRESVEKVARSHAQMKERLELARHKHAAEVATEAKGALASIGRAVRDSLLNLGGPVDPPPA